MAELLAILACLALLPALEKNDDASVPPERSGFSSTDYVTDIDDCDFTIPVGYNEAMRPKIRALNLYLSTDKGKSWHKQRTITPKDNQFEFHAPADGEYWFAVQVVDKEGKKQPEKVSLKSLPQIVKVQVQTSSKPSTDSSTEDKLKAHIAELGAKLGETEDRLAKLEAERKAKIEEYAAQISELRARLAKVEKRLAELEGSGKKKKK